VVREPCPHCGAVAIPDVATHIAFTADCLNGQLDTVWQGVTQQLSEDT